MILSCGLERRVKKVERGQGKYEEGDFEGYIALVDDKLRTITVVVQGSPEVRLVFDEDGWEKFYEFVWKVNNTLNW